MTCARTWHLWRCDGCGKEQQLEHGEWAEPALPEGWFATLGWGLHACSEACRETIQTKHRAETGKVFIFIEWREQEVARPQPPPPPPPESLLAQPRRRGRPPRQKPPAVFG